MMRREGRVLALVLGSWVVWWGGVVADRFPDASTASEASPLRFNGWYPCGLSLPTEPSQQDPDLPTQPPNGLGDRFNSSAVFLEYECGELELPLCHQGICSSAKRIDVFVKRLRAQQPNRQDQPQKAVWVLQGGPGGSSSAMEDLMHVLYNQFNQSVHVYTMDHRGTGRSFFLRCDAAQAFSEGSPSGEDISFEELPNCINDLLFKMEGNTVAFSVTSAATDLAKAIDFFHVSTLQEPEEVYVYGVSYGSFLVERLVHLAPPQVKGYILDGVESESGRDFVDKSSFCHPNENVDEVTRRLLLYCLENAKCLYKMNQVLAPFLPEDSDSNRLADALVTFYKQWDANQIVSQCILQLAYMNAGQFQRDSHVLKLVLSFMLLDSSMRGLIPAFLYRFIRCDQAKKSDLDFVTEMIVYLFAPPTPTISNGRFSGILKGSASANPQSQHATAPEQRISTMLYDLIVFSEMWEVPTPTPQQYLDSLNRGIAGSTDGHLEVAEYCLLTGSGQKVAEDAQVCDQLPEELPESKPFFYQVDQYWNKTAAIPEDASVMLLSGKLDALTLDRYAHKQYMNYRGGDAILVQFDYAGHGAAWETPLMNSDVTCGIKVIVSYVQHRGDIDSVDTSCLDQLMPLEFDLPPEIALVTFGIDDVYEGTPLVVQPWKKQHSVKHLKQLLRRRVKKATRQWNLRKRVGMMRP